MIHDVHNDPAHTARQYIKRSTTQLPAGDAAGALQATTTYIYTLQLTLAV
jgi:hypothetical protein